MIQISSYFYETITGGKRWLTYMYCIDMSNQTFIDKVDNGQYLEGYRLKSEMTSETCVKVWFITT